MAWRRLVVVLVAATGIYLACYAAGRGVGRLAEGGRVPSTGEHVFPTSALVTYGLMVAVSALLTTRDGVKTGLALGKPRARWGNFVPLGLLVGCLTTLVMRLTSAKGMGEGMARYGPLMMFVTIGFGSVAEEVFVRGWLQGRLEPLRDRMVDLGGLRLSVPVVASGLFFSAMHLMLLARGADPWTVGFVLVFTAVLGLLAARAREVTGSLWPAVATHVAGNVGGVIGGVISVVIQVMRTGKLPVP